MNEHSKNQFANNLLITVLMQITKCSRPTKILTIPKYGI